MEESKKKGRIISAFEIIAIILMLSGLILFPMHLRYALLSDEWGTLARLNVPFLAGTVLLLLLKRIQKPYNAADMLMIFSWFLCTAIFLYSNCGKESEIILIAFFNLIFPIMILLVRFRKPYFQRLMFAFLLFFDIFIAVLLICAVIERLTGNLILDTINSYVQSSEYATYLSNPSWVQRFYSLWGHALTNAVLFNAFFILNDVYFHCRRKRYPKLLFFLVAMVGAALCAGKTAIVILLAYMVISCLPDFKKYGIKMLAGGVVILVVLYASGLLDKIITRFSNSQLTSGRMEALIRYFKIGVYPLKWFSGYGNGFVYSKLSSLKLGFEFPLMMHALHYGIVFSVLLLLGFYFYGSYFILKQKQYLCWIGFTLLYVQENCYNGLSLANQDCFMWACVFAMILINCAEGCEIPQDSIEQTDGTGQKSQNEEAGRTEGADQTGRIETSETAGISDKRAKGKHDAADG